MKYLYIFVCLASYVGILRGQDTLTVIGTVQGDYRHYPKVYVYGADVTRDSAQIVDGKFTFNIPFKAGIVPLFYTEYSLKVTKHYRPLPAVVDRPGILYLDNVRVDQDMHTATWRGIKSASDYQSFDNKLQAAIKGLSTRDSLVKQLSREHLAAFVNSNPESYASAYILSVIGKMELSVDDLHRCYKVLAPELRSSTIGTDLHDYIEGLRRASIGNIVPDFTLEDPDGHPVDFKSLRGKYVIVDFWASWCGPCIKSFPHLRKLHEKYDDKPFEIYGVSIDQNRDYWLKACEELDLPWLLTHDTKSISTTHFGVHAIPTAFLIDPDGKVLAKEIGIDTSGNGVIEQKLIEAFSK